VGELDLDLALRALLNEIGDGRSFASVTRNRLTGEREVVVAARGAEADELLHLLGEASALKPSAGIRLLRQFAGAKD
jgi:hypothetical protein